MTISIHALLAESDPILLPRSRPGSISIHALLAESDGFQGRQQLIGDISIHALLAESDRWVRSRRQPSSNFYPRSPCGERLPWTRLPKTSICISIHALLAESDFQGPCFVGHGVNFYPRSPCGERPFDTLAGTFRSSFLSTLSLRRATILPHLPMAALCISIHALLAESDFIGSV